MRLDDRIEFQDFLARMPYRQRQNATVVEGLYEPFYKKTGTLSNRAREFRNHVGSFTWRIRSERGSERIKRFMDARRGPAQRANNTIKGLRNLNDTERLFLEALNFCSQPKRARKNRRKGAAQGAAARSSHRDRFREKFRRLDLLDILDNNGVPNGDRLDQAIATMYPAWIASAASSSHGLAAVSPSGFGIGADGLVEQTPASGAVLPSIEQSPLDIQVVEGNMVDVVDMVDNEDGISDQGLLFLMHMPRPSPIDGEYSGLWDVVDDTARDTTPQFQPTTSEQLVPHTSAVSMEDPALYSHVD